MRKQTRILLLLLAVAGCYGPLLLSGSLGFVYDDARFVSENRAVQDLGNAGRFFTDPRTVDPHAWSGIYRPLRTLDFALDWALFPGRPRWFHLRNAAYHALAVLLLYGLFRRWGAGETASTLGALVFALHPVQVESVAWITSRGDLLFLLFFLLALHAHDRSRGRDGWLLAAAGALALSLLSKEEAVVFPACAVLADFFFRDRRRPSAVLRRWPHYLLYTVVVGLYLAVFFRIHALHGQSVAHVAGRWGGSFLGTVLLMGRGLLYYLRLIFLPVDMANDFYLAPARGLDLPGLLLVAAALLGTLLAVRTAFRKGGAAPFALLWFLAALLPVSNLVVPIAIPTAERFLYLPMVGIAFWAGGLLARAFQRPPLGPAAVVVLLACLFGVSLDRTFVWRNNGTFWNAILDRFESPRALEWKADTIRGEGERLMREATELGDRDRIEEARKARALARRRLREALRVYDREIEMWRATPEPEGAVAIVRAKKALALFDLRGEENYRAALREADALLARWPRLGKAHLARALALLGLGRLREAARSIEAALEEWNTPQYRRAGAKIYESLAEVMSHRGYRALTYRYLKRSWSLLGGPERDPSLNPAVYASLVRIENELARGLRILDAAIRRDPGRADPYLEKAELLARHGRYGEARKLYDQLMRPEQLGRDPRVLFSFARYYWEERDTAEGCRNAVDLYREILRDHPRYAALPEVNVRAHLARCRERLADLSRGEEER